MTRVAANDATSVRTIRVVVVDDHPIIRDVTRRVLAEEPDIEVIADHASIESLVAAGTDADVVVLDLSLPGRGGLEAIPDIVSMYPTSRILVLTMHVNRSVCAAAIERGATGFIGKGCHPNDLVSSVRAVAAGERFVPADLVGAPTSARLTLSPNERTLVSLLAEGWRLSDIANEIGCGIWEANAMKKSLEERTNCRSIDDWRRLAVLHNIDRRR
jgi:DNA-binding NarL/FixJ family response regulator